MRAYLLLCCLYLQNIGNYLPSRPLKLWAKPGTVTWWRTVQLSGIVGTACRPGLSNCEINREQSHGGGLGNSRE